MTFPFTILNISLKVVVVVDTVFVVAVVTVEVDFRSFLDFADELLDSIV